jgi:hypothetical protein
VRRLGVVLEVAIVRVRPCVNAIVALSGLDGRLNSPRDRGRGRSLWSGSNDDDLPETKECPSWDDGDDLFAIQQ